MADASNPFGCAHGELEFCRKCTEFVIPVKPTLEDRLRADLVEAEAKAWDSLARYKFFMFGYHAADVVKLRRRLGGNTPNPFKALVDLARERRRG